MTTRTVRLHITGRVQGVWFRGWAVETATALGLDGWVRNRSDGSVDVLAAGPADAVDRLIVACHDGPPAARVADVEVREVDEAVPAGFRQVASA